MQIQKPVFRQQQQQKQTLKMTPQMYQSIQLMALPVQGLRERIEEEVEKNPALEIVEEKSTLSYEEAETTTQGPDTEYEIFENTSDPGYTSKGSSQPAEGDSKRMFLENAFSRTESLHDHLLWQLRLQPISCEKEKIGELLINNLDDNGFHIEEPEKLVHEENHKKMYKVMEIIRSFDPVGVCTSNYKEALLVQLSFLDDTPDGAEELIKNHLELLEKGKNKEIARKMKKSEEDIEEIIRQIRSLNPFPGSVYTSEKPRYVIPDLTVKLIEGEFVIMLNDDQIPVLGIDSFHNRLLNQKNNKKDVKTFVNNNVKGAQWFIKSIHQRNETLLRTGQAIIEFQRDFFMKGPKYLKPLTLKDIALELDLHEATISRITTNKYMQTEWGIFELKYFFSNSISGTGSGGSRHSKSSVKEIIKEILQNENNGSKHLSDQKISDILKRRGISLSRRAVSKYRKELGIMSSYRR